jgi:hypothetical protein
MGKSSKIKLSIPKPCIEVWDKMTISEQGKFCSSCQKSVVDFSNYTDKELLDYFTNAKERTCGRISSNQLNRLIIASEPSNTPVYKRILFGTALAASVAGTAHSQTNATVTNGTTQANQKTNKEKRPVSDSTIKISGSVANSGNKKPLSGVSIMILCDTSQIAYIYTDANGKFEAAIDKNLLGKKLTIIATQYAYHDWIKKYTLTNTPKYLSIRMNKTVGDDNIHMTMGDIQMTPPTKKDSTIKSNK